VAWVCVWSPVLLFCETTADYFSITKNVSVPRVSGPCGKDHHAPPPHTKRQCIGNLTSRPAPRRPRLLVSLSRKHARTHVTPPPLLPPPLPPPYTHTQTHRHTQRFRHPPPPPPSCTMVCWYHFHPHLTWHLEAITHDFSDNFWETLFRPDLVYLKHSDPFVSLLFISLWFAFLTGLIGGITQEFSWVDRIWSLTPPFYAWLFALHPFLALGEDWPSPPGGYFFARPFLLAWLTTLWGGRLTYNFWRKGGYAGGGEDYRWAEIRTWFSHFTLQMFNIFFIALFQVWTFCFLRPFPNLFELHRPLPPDPSLSSSNPILYFSLPRSPPSRTSSSSSSSCPPTPPG